THAFAAHVAVAIDHVSSPHPPVEERAIAAQALADPALYRPVGGSADGAADEGTSLGEVLLPVAADCFPSSPGLDGGSSHRGPMKPAQAFRHAIDDLLRDGAATDHLVEHPVGGQTPHEDGVIDRPAGLGEARRAVSLHDGLHAEVRLVAEAPVQLQLGLASAPAPLEGGVV